MILFIYYDCHGEVLNFFLVREIRQQKKHFGQILSAGTHKQLKS